MLDGLTGVPLATEQDGVGAGWGAGGQLVEGDRLATSVQDALLGSTRESEGGNRELGNLQQPDVISHSPDGDNDLRVAIGCA